MKTKKMNTVKRVIVRADSGVWFGTLVASKGREATIRDLPRIYHWKSGGLSRPVLCTEDLAILDAGEGTQISGVAPELVIVDVRGILKCTPEAIKQIEALPCKG